MRKVKVNEKEYTIQPYTINMDCELEEFGLTINDLTKKRKSFIRAYFAISAGMTKEQAGVEINEHIIKTGNINELSEAIAKEIEESDFFRKIIEEAKKNAEAREAEKEEAAIEA